MRAAEPPQSDRPSPGPGDGAARVRRRRPRWLSSAALLSVAAVLLAAGWVSRQDRPAGDRTVGEVTRVGIAAGDPIPGYLRAAGAELAALPAADTYALVSFSTYVAPGGLPALLDGVSVAEVVARVPLPGRQTEIVRLPAQWLPQDVTAGMAGVAARKDREAADQRARAAGAADPELRRGYATGAQVAAGEAVAYRTGCACAYAAVVRGAPEPLRALAGRPRVRAVDPAPELRRLDRTVVTPPLPEQRDVARPPADTGPVPGMGETSEAAPAKMGETSEAAPMMAVTSPIVDPAAPTAAVPGAATSPDAGGGGPEAVPR
ncbi:hypothetical protein [Micromonospora sp. RTGN7]|uniref:hypothetical protein n=1 Tax=Micromonospora sp. RTGN7 TaxID=3016526 RepID=UPI0029FEE2A6|nr:hypothetical protein [Micromonospora sp. RTGN7]